MMRPKYLLIVADTGKKPASSDSRLAVQQRRRLSSNCLSAAAAARPQANTRPRPCRRRRTDRSPSNTGYRHHRFAKCAPRRSVGHHRIRTQSPRRRIRPFASIAGSPSPSDSSSATHTTRYNGTLRRRPAQSVPRVACAKRRHRGLSAPKPGPVRASLSRCRSAVIPARSSVRPSGPTRHHLRRRRTATSRLARRRRQHARPVGQAPRDRAARARVRPRRRMRSPCRDDSCAPMSVSVV